MFSEVIKVTFRERVEYVLKERGMTQKMLAERLHLSTSTVSAYLVERRGIPKEVLADLCRILRVSADYLLGLTGAREPTITLQQGEQELIKDLRALSAKERNAVYHMVSDLKEE